MNKRKFIDFTIIFIKSFSILMIFGIILPYFFKKILYLYLFNRYTNKNVIFVNGVLDKNLIFMYNFIYTIRNFLIINLY